MITLYDYKSYHNITNVNDDSKIGRAVLAANKIVEKYTGVLFSEDTQTFTANPGNYVFLPHNNADSIVSVISGGVEVTGHYLDDSGVLEIHSELYSHNPRSLIVEYTVPSIVPYDLVVATIELASYYIDREFNMSKSISGESIDYNDSKTLPSQVKLVLDLYRCL